MFIKRVAGATSDHGSWTLCPRRSQGPCADTCCLGEVLLKREVGSAIRILVNPSREEFEAFASIKQHERAVKGIEASVTASDCELPEWFGFQVDSKSIAPSRIVGCAVHVLSQSEKHDHNVRVRLRTRKSRAELAQTSETVNPEDVGDEMAKLDPSKTTETSLGRRTVASEAHGEKSMAAKRFHKLHKCAQESKSIGERADDREQEESHLKIPHPKIQHSRVFSVHMLQVCGHIKHVVVLVAMLRVITSLVVNRSHIFTFHLYVNSLQIL